ncbi:MAG: hemolysin family protein [Candidatus Omnitrophica bacterium]|nr:hemolysin family protein [Candidatus Omnitrophota bacterium]
MATIIFLSVLLLLLACFSFIFSLAETAIIGLSKIRLNHMIAKGVKSADTVQRLLRKSDKFITAILIGNNIINIAMSSIIAAVFIHMFGPEWGVLAATGVSALFILTLCEITPKIIALKNTEAAALFTAPVMETVTKVLSPLIRAFTFITSAIFKVLKLKFPKRSPLITEEELRLMIEMGKEEGVLTDEERRMLHRIFEFGDIKAGDVMVPREKMVMVNINSTQDDLLNTFAEEGHARLPVYQGGRDTIVGVIYARDLHYILTDKVLFVLNDLIHKPRYVPCSMRVNEVLRMFQTEKIQIAIVVDDNKKAVGMVTLEDLLEEIVGELEEVHPSDYHDFENHGKADK